MLTALIEWLQKFFRVTGECGLFGFRAIRQVVQPPFEIGETVSQLFGVGWRSSPLIIVSGFAFGVVLALQTRSSMQQFGAGAMIPQAISLGLFRDIGPLLAALLVSGRLGAGIGAELAGMQVTEQIDALESLAVDSFKYLCVTPQTIYPNFENSGFRIHYRNYLVFPRVHGYGRLGRSGIGKSVTLKVLIGLIPPNRGEIFIEGQNVQ